MVDATDSPRIVRIPLLRIAVALAENANRDLYVRGPMALPMESVSAPARFPVLALGRHRRQLRKNRHQINALPCKPRLLGFAARGRTPWNKSMLRAIMRWTVRPLVWWQNILCF